MKPSLNLHVICKIPLIWHLILFLILYSSFPDILCHHRTRLCQLLCPRFFSLLITFTHFSLLIFPTSSPVKLCISSRSWLMFHFLWDTSCESLYQVRIPLLYVYIPFSSCPQSLPASVFSNESTLRMRWPKYWSFSFSIIPCKEQPEIGRAHV